MDLTDWEESRKSNGKSRQQEGASSMYGWGRMLRERESITTKSKTHLLSTPHPPSSAGHPTPAQMLQKRLKHSQKPINQSNAASHRTFNKRVSYAIKPLQVSTLARHTDAPLCLKLLRRANLDPSPSKQAMYILPVTWTTLRYDSRWHSVYLKRHMGLPGWAFAWKAADELTILTVVPLCHSDQVLHHVTAIIKPS